MSEEFADLIIRVIGDVIDVEDHNSLVRALQNLFKPVHVENQPQPIQVSKPSILLLLAEGTCTPDFPNSISVFLSSDNVIYEEVASEQWYIVDLLQTRTLTIPIPKGYYVKWIVPYGFIKSAVIF